MRRDRLSIQRIEKFNVDSLEVLAELNDFAMYVCCQSIIDENPKISDEELLRKLREIVRMKV
ncbi:hypothetical protein DRO69_01195 [Candidatus Bathyarchaeota archaeon]|nr:MAG: hypothetical protein DRO69_01195 [Candidatus Bathyarchaeota archaeon]